jgi:hypothetical protein
LSPHAARDNDFLARPESADHVLLVEPNKLKRSGIIAGWDIDDGEAGAPVETAAAAHRHFQARTLSILQLTNRLEMAAIFVAAGEKAEQVGHGFDARCFQKQRPLRTDAGQSAHWRIGTCCKRRLPARRAFSLRSQGYFGEVG